MHARVLAGLSCAGLLICSVAAAQEQAPLVPLPEVGVCEGSAHPRLPQQWHATYLLAPFTKGQLVLGDIVLDASRPAMRVRLLGVRRGSADLFIRGSSTYALVSNGSAITECRDLGDTGWRPLPQDWLTSGSQCTAAAPIGETAVNW